MKRTKILGLLLLACTAGLYSCSSDDVKTALDAPMVSESAATYNSLSFEWNSVTNAVQYGYRLADAEGVAVDAGVTHGTHVTLTGLEPATTYTLQVWAFASMDGDYSTPPAVTLTATTSPLIKLAIPANLEAVSDDGYTYTMSWSAVADAASYTYTITNDSGDKVKTGQTEKTSVKVSTLDTGDYTFAVRADAGAGYEDSAPAMVSIHVVKPLFTVKGTYYSEQLGRSWAATMYAYEGDRYVIKAFYGVEGYDLEFRIDKSDEDNMFKITNGKNVYMDEIGETTQVPTGLSNPSVIVAFTVENNSYLEGNKDKGYVDICNYYGEDYSDWGYDEFVWPATSSKSNRTHKATSPRPPKARK